MRGSGPNGGTKYVEKTTFDRENYPEIAKIQELENENPELMKMAAAVFNLPAGIA